MLPKSVSTAQLPTHPTATSRLAGVAGQALVDEEFSSWRVRRRHALHVPGCLHRAPPVPPTLVLLLLLVQAKHPCILQHFDAFLERVNGKRVAVFLDYDGTS